MGNSEVGHLNIGAGRVVYQELTRINRAIEDGSLLENQVLREAIDAAILRGGAIHFMGLLSDGGVHSHQEHLYALLRMAVRCGAHDVFVHCFMDGRDVPPTSGARYIRMLEEVLARLETGSIASVMGRYYAMDRDKRWERVSRAWRAMVLGEGATADSAVSAVEASYAAGITDEFIEPTIIRRGDARAGTVRDGDSVIFFNFRPDRAREITRAFVDDEFDGFTRDVVPDIDFVCLTEYDPTIPAPVAFPKDLPCCVLADVLASAGLRQLHIAETEKYAHVTFFLNGGVEVPKEGRSVSSCRAQRSRPYDLKPEMSAPEVTARLVEAIRSSRADFYVVNYANCDMVGHTGVLSAAIRAVEAVDDGVGQVVNAIHAVGGSVIVTADHGNAEKMLDEAGKPFTAHTSNKVPCIVVRDGVRAVRDDGLLADIAPTVLDLLHLEQPAEWTGRTLMVNGLEW